MLFAFFMLVCPCPKPLQWFHDARRSSHVISDPGHESRMAVILAPSIDRLMNRVKMEQDIVALKLMNIPAEIGEIEISIDSKQ